MKRFLTIILILLSLLFSIVIFSCDSKVSGTDKQLMERASTLAQKFILIDTHIDVPYRLKNHWEDISQLTENGHFDYVRARKGGLDVVFMSIFIPASYQQTGGAKELADSLIQMVDGFVEKWPDKFVRVNSPAEIRQKFDGHKILLTMGMENGAGIEDDLKNLEYFYKRGIRYITLAHGKWNRICDSSYDPERKWHGLSPFGKEVVKKMNRLGIMIDVSHITDEAFYQVLEISRAPIIASHSACRHFTPGFERNMSDEMIKALAEKGGVIQISFGSYFLREDYQKKTEQISNHIETYLKEHHLSRTNSAAIEYIKAYRQANKPNPGTIDDLIDHIDHAVKIAGIDHVGLGSDFDGVSSLPKGLEDVSTYPNIIYHLLKRGYSEDDIRKICGENLLRVWEQVEKVAKQLSFESTGFKSGNSGGKHF